ncbi:phage tail protein [Vibrio cholerae]
MTQPLESQQQHGSILTILGENAEQNGKLQNKQITFTHMAIGDANDQYVQPNRKQTSLINELARIPINSVDVLQPTPDSVPMLKVEAILPDDVNDLVIREFAAVATFDGNSYFHAVGTCGRIYVPAPINNGNVSTPVTLEMIFVITSAEPIVEIDPNVIIASRDYANQKSGFAVDQATGYRVYPDDITKNASSDNHNIIPDGANALRVKKNDGTLKVCSMSPVVVGHIQSIDLATMTAVIAGVKVYLSEVDPEVFNGNAKSFGIKPGAVRSDRLQAFFDQCEAKGWVPFFPDGEYFINGNFILPQYGIKGQSRLSTKLLIDDSVDGVVFDYNYVGGWNTGQGQLDNITVSSNRKCKANLFKISTPSRGFLLNNVGLKVGSGAAIQLMDSYYINFFNVAFSGDWIGQEPVTEDERLIGTGIRVLDREINNIYWNKCDFKDLGSCVIGSGDVFKGSNSLQFTSCAFERIGDVCFNANGFHAKFDSCYFEKLDQNKALNRNSSELIHTTAVAIAGAGDLIFDNCLINGKHVRNDDPKYAFFHSVLNKIVFNSGHFGKPDNYVGEVLRDVTYSSRAIVVNNSCAGLTDISRPAYERPNQQFSKVYVDISNKSQIAAAPLMSDDTYASNSYTYTTLPTATMYGFNNPQPFGLVDGSISREYVSVQISARQYRLNVNTKKLGWIDLNVNYTISPDCPLLITPDEVEMTYHGDKSTFGDDVDSLKGKLQIKRVTSARPTMDDTYDFAYQVAIIGETGNAIPKKLSTRSKIELTVVNFDDNVRDMRLGIYQQLPAFSSFA